MNRYILSHLLYLTTLSLQSCALLIPFTNSNHQPGEEQADIKLSETVAPVQDDQNLSSTFSISPKAQPTAPVELKSPGPLPLSFENIAITGSWAKSDLLYREILKKLRHGNAAERTCAATNLGLLRRAKQDLIPHLIQVLKSDESKWVRRAAVKSLGKIGGPQVIQPLREALQDRDAWVAHSAQNILHGSTAQSAAMIKEEHSA